MVAALKASRQGGGNVVIAEPNERIVDTLKLVGLGPRCSSKSTMSSKPSTPFDDALIVPAQLDQLVQITRFIGEVAGRTGFFVRRS